jgi:peptidase MA superfamily protein/tetratricopeptide repeat protein
MALAIAVVMLRARVTAVLCFLALFVVSVHGQSHVNELNDAGWKALRDGYQDRAANLFAEALTLRPNDPVLLTGAGAAAHAQGKQKEALTSLQRALEVRPGLTEASILLGQIAFDEGDVDLAIRAYESALKYAPDDEELASRLDVWRTEAKIHQSFNELRYERFRVLFEGHAEQSMAIQATDVFNSAFFSIANRLGEYPPNTIVAVLYTEQQFRDVTRAPVWAAGQYDGRIRIPVAGASQQPELFEKVLTHELTHAVVAGIAPSGVPTWLNEGLAQYFDGSDANAAQRRMKALGRSIPLKRLEASFAHLSTADAQVAYDESLLAVSVMADRPAFGWTRLLHQLSDGQSFDDAIGSFGFSYADLEAPFAR